MKICFVFKRLHCLLWNWKMCWEFVLTGIAVSSSCNLPLPHLTLTLVKASFSGHHLIKSLFHLVMHISLYPLHYNLQHTFAQPWRCYLAVFISPYPVHFNPQYTCAQPWRCYLAVSTSPYPVHYNLQHTFVQPWGCYLAVSTSLYPVHFTFFVVVVWLLPRTWRTCVCLCVDGWGMRPLKG